MQFCEEHWAVLREAIDERDLGHLVRKGSEVAAIKTLDDLMEVDTFPTIKTFDPLDFAHWSIASNVMEFVGLAVFYPDDNGSPRCPLCALTEFHADNCSNPECDIVNFDDWIEQSADEAQLKWEELKALERGDDLITQ